MVFIFRNIIRRNDYSKSLRIVEKWTGERNDINMVQYKCGEYGG